MASNVKLTVAMIRDLLTCDSVSKRGSVFTVRRCFRKRDYRFASDFAVEVLQVVPGIELIEMGEHFSPYKENDRSPVARRTHWWVSFREGKSWEPRPHGGPAGGLQCDCDACQQWDIDDANDCGIPMRHTSEGM